MFCAYDFSAVSPPVDVEVGSNAHLERCVQKIAVIIKNMNRMVGLSPEHPARAALKSLLSFATMLANKHSPEGQEMRENLNATMPATANWMAARFLGAARFYKKEVRSWKCELISSLLYSNSSFAPRLVAARRRPGHGLRGP